jgi:hypothetical protein
MILDVDQQVPNFDSENLIETGDLQNNHVIVVEQQCLSL